MKIEKNETLVRTSGGGTGGNGGEAPGESGDGEGVPAGKVSSESDVARVQKSRTRGSGKECCGEFSAKTTEMESEQRRRCHYKYHISFPENGKTKFLIIIIKQNSVSEGSMPYHCYPVLELPLPHPSPSNDQCRFLVIPPL